MSNLVAPRATLVRDNERRPKRWHTMAQHGQSQSKFRHAPDKQISQFAPRTSLKLSATRARVSISGPAHLNNNVRQLAKCRAAESDPRLSSLSPRRGRSAVGQRAAHNRPCVVKRQVAPIGDDENAKLNSAARKRKCK